MRTWVVAAVVLVMAAGMLGCEGSMGARGDGERRDSTLGDLGVRTSGSVQVGRTSGTR